MKDLRDPKAIGELLLDRQRAFFPRSSTCELADDLLSGRFPLPLVAGDASPLERYGDPRDYDVIVETTTRRVPTDRAFLRGYDETYPAITPIEYRVGDLVDGACRPIERLA